jgi:DNA repair exonuclease SbcCD ATPase subunit
MNCLSRPLFIVAWSGLLFSVPARPQGPAPADVMAEPIRLPQIRSVLRFQSSPDSLPEVPDTLDPAKLNQCVGWRRIIEAERKVLAAHAGGQTDRSTLLKPDIDALARQREAVDALEAVSVQDAERLSRNGALIDERHASLEAALKLPHASAREAAARKQSVDAFNAELKRHNESIAAHNSGRATLRQAIAQYNAAVAALRARIDAVETRHAEYDQRVEAHNLMIEGYSRDCVGQRRLLR